MCGSQFERYAERRKGEKEKATVTRQQGRKRLTRLRQSIKFQSINNCWREHRREREKERERGRGRGGRHEHES